jgi:hypothetical protein
MGKTTIEKQIQAYGEFTRQIRNMSKEEQLKYAAPGTPESEKYQNMLRNESERKAERDKLMKQFDKDYKPMYGNLNGLTPEQVREIANQSSAFSEKRKAYYKEISDRLGLNGYKL